MMGGYAAALGGTGGYKIQSGPVSAADRNKKLGSASVRQIDPVMGPIGASGPSAASSSVGDPASPSLTPQSLASAFSSASPATAAATPAPAAPINLAATPDPAYQNFLSSMTGRLNTLQSHENDPVEVGRAQDLANRDIFGAAAGRKKRTKEELAALGLRTDVGVGANRLRAVDEAAQTRSAKSAADIAVARERDQDRINLERQGAVNALYGGLGNFAQVPFSQAMQGSNLALNAWKAADDSAINRASLANNAQQSQLQNWLSLMRAF